MRSLWNDTFQLKIQKTTNPYQQQFETLADDSFTGSLKGAIRYALEKYQQQKGNFTITFLDSTGEYIKEIGW